MDDLLKALGIVLLFALALAIGFLTSEWFNDAIADSFKH